MPQKIEISYKTIVFTVLFLLGFWFLWSIQTIILQFFVAIIVTTAFSPIVRRLERFDWNGISISRTTSIVITYLVFFAVAGIFITLIAQPFVVQTSTLISQLPDLIEHLDGIGISQAVIERQLTQLNTLPADILKLITGVFSNLLSVFTTMVMAFYMLLERERLHKHLAVLFGNKDLERRVEKFIDYLELRLGGWVRAEVLLMFLVGLMTYGGLWLLNVPFALPLAIIAGLLEVVPNIGPTLSAVPAVIIGFTISPLLGIGVIVLYLFIQLLENNFLVPQVMAKTVGINPLVTIVVLLIGYNLSGVLGAVLGVPTVLLIQALLHYFYPERFVVQSGEGKR